MVLANAKTSQRNRCFCQTRSIYHKTRTVEDRITIAAERGEIVEWRDA
jgi:hypothetical protein